MSRVLKETKLSGFLLVILFLILWELSVASGAIKLVSWPAFSSVMIYVVMAAVLLLKPGGLMPVRTLHQ